MHAREVVAFTLLSALGLVALPRAANACSASPCGPALSAPQSGILPANALGLPHYVSGDAARVFRLLDPGNAEVPTTLKSYSWWSHGELLVPNAPLAAGNGYHVVYDETCVVAPVKGEVKNAFDLGPAVALPVTAGILRFTGRVVGPRSVRNSNGSCTSTIEAVAIDVRVSPSPELLAYAKVAGFKVTLDGQEEATIYYGAAKTDAEGIVVTTLHAACGVRAQGDSNGPALGVHTIGVRAHVAGATSDPPELTGAFEFFCDGAGKDGGGDGGGGDGGGGGAGGGVADSGQNSFADDTTPSGCACTTTGGPSDWGGTALLVASTIVAVGAKRQSRQRAPR